MNFKNGYLLLFCEWLMQFKKQQQKNRKTRGGKENPPQSEPSPKTRLKRLRNNNKNRKRKPKLSSGKLSNDFMSMTTHADYVLIKPHSLTEE